MLSVDDIIVSDFNSTVYAFDGKSYTPIWTYAFQGSIFRSLKHKTKDKLI